MRFIKFTMSNKKEYTFQEWMAKRILADPRKLYPIIEDDGQFHGRTINKAHIIETDYDYEAQKRWQDAENAKKLRLEAPSGLEEKQRKESLKRLDIIRKDLIRKKVIGKNKVL